MVTSLPLEQFLFKPVSQFWNWLENKVTDEVVDRSVDSPEGQNSFCLVMDGRDLSHPSSTTYMDPVTVAFLTGWGGLVGREIETLRLGPRSKYKRTIQVSLAVGLVDLWAKGVIGLEEYEPSSFWFQPEVLRVALSGALKSKFASNLSSIL